MTVDVENNKVRVSYAIKDTNSEILVGIPVKIVTDDSADVSNLVDVWQNLSKHKLQREETADQGTSVRPPDKTYGYISNQILMILDNSREPIRTSDFIEFIDASRPSIMKTLRRLRDKKQNIKTASSYKIRNYCSFAREKIAFCDKNTKYLR